MAERRFLAWLFGTAFFSALLVAVFCFEVDPYLVFGRPRLAGINDIKMVVDFSADDIVHRVGVAVLQKQFLQADVVQIVDAAF